jgi:hypothetical protein
VSLSPSYRDTLARFPRTRPLKEFTPGAAGVFLRHDVDHDLDLALEMAFWEREAGHRSTWFILPTAPYAQDPRLLPKLRQLQAFGHEVGVHLNFLASWVRREVESVEGAAAALLRGWRGAGLEIAGCAAHGDRACYEFNFINYWMFRELRPADPRAESGLSPEGIRDPDPGRRIAYPESHRLRRADGAEFPLWSVSMGSLGLHYHATHLPMEHYYSDSGGGWRRTGSPLEADLSRGSHQVLMHPEYYRGPRKRIFVASTARSGSKWLAQVAAAATPCHSVHEFSFNHRYADDGRLVAEKRTHAGFTGLQHSPEAAELLLDTARYAESLEKDYFECNVYLAHFLPLLKSIIPDATVVQLHRHPRDVVRSILNRDWYDTPEDDRHPAFDDDAWRSAGQFERACFYVANTLELIKGHAAARVPLERIAADLDALAAFFRSLDIAFYPELAREAFGTPANAGRGARVPRFEDWPAERQATFLRICGPALRDLGYEVSGALSPGPPRATPAQGPERIDEHPFFDLARRRWPLFSRRLTGRRTAAGLLMRPHASGGYITLGGGFWRRIVPALQGWHARRDAYYRVECRGEGRIGEVVLFALFYDWAGKLIRAQQFSRLTPSKPEASGAFRVSDKDCRWVSIGLRVSYPRSAVEDPSWRLERLQARTLALAGYRVE